MLSDFDRPLVQANLDELVDVEAVESQEVARIKLSELLTHVLNKAKTYRRLTENFGHRDYFKQDSLIVSLITILTACSALDNNQFDNYVETLEEGVNQDTPELPFPQTEDRLSRILEDFQLHSGEVTDLQPDDRRIKAAKLIDATLQRHFATFIAEYSGVTARMDESFVNLSEELHVGESTLPNVKDMHIIFIPTLFSKVWHGNTAHANDAHSFIRYVDISGNLREPEQEALTARHEMAHEIMAQYQMSDTEMLDPKDPDFFQKIQADIRRRLETPRYDEIIVETLAMMDRLDDLDKNLRTAYGVGVRRLRTLMKSAAMQKYSCSAEEAESAWKRDFISIFSGGTKDINQTVKDYYNETNQPHTFEQEMFLYADTVTKSGDADLVELSDELVRLGFSDAIIEDILEKLQQSIDSGITDISQIDLGDKSIVDWSQRNV